MPLSRGAYGPEDYKRLKISPSSLPLSLPLPELILSSQRIFLPFFYSVFSVLLLLFFFIFILLLLLSGSWGLTLLLARVGRNRFPEASAHYRPAGLAITCEASFDFVCASQRSFRLYARPSEIRLDGSSKSRKRTSRRKFSL